MSEAIIAYGATVKRSTDGITFTSIPECKGVAIPATEQEYIEVTSLDSPNGFREYIRGMKDAGNITVPCGYTADGYEQQLADEAAADAIYYEVILKKQPSQTVVGDRFTFRGFPVPQLSNGGADQLVEMNIAIRITGDVTWTKGS
jgi:predicted secreted protein